MPQKVTRLYNQFRPENYQLNLELDRDNLRFSGHVVIRGRKTGPPQPALNTARQGPENYQ